DAEALVPTTHIGDFLHGHLGVHPQVTIMLVVLHKELGKRFAFLVERGFQLVRIRSSGLETTESLVDVGRKAATSKLPIIRDIDANVDLLADNGMHCKANVIGQFYRIASAQDLRLDVLDDLGRTNETAGVGCQYPVGAAFHVNPATFRYIQSCRGNSGRSRGRWCARASSLGPWRQPGESTRPA